MNKNINPPKPKLLDQMRDRIRYKHYSLSTEKVYIYWCRFFIRWSGMRHPKEMGAPEIEDFLTMLVSVRHVSASTHKQALSGILFLYKEVLQIDLPWMQQIGRPKTEQRLPTVLTALEVQSVFGNLELINPEHALFAKLLYGTGIRIMEAARLRIKDIEFDRSAIIIREGKGSKDRVVMLPESLRIDLMAQVARCKLRWQSDTEHQMSGVEMPFALDVKYPRAGHSLAWLGFGCFRSMFFQRIRPAV